MTKQLFEFKIGLTFFVKKPKDIFIRTWSYIIMMSYYYVGIFLQKITKLSPKQYRLYIKRLYEE